MSAAEVRPFDVAVVGYGPVGVTAANLLGEMGLRVLVLDREPSVYERARAISTDEEVIRIWQAIGLSERLKADMLSEKPIDFVDADGQSFMSIVPTPRGNAHPTQLFIYQPALEEVLRAGVGRYPNVAVRLGHECLGLTQDAEGVDLTVRARDGVGTYGVRARYVIAADGGSSPIRGHLGIGFEGRTYEDRWVVIDTKVKQEWPEVERLRFHCDPQRPAVDCPTPLGHHRWEFPILPGDDEEQLITEPAVRRLLADQGIGPEHVDILRAVVYSHHVRLADRWRVGRVFLAGDAAHVMPPWIGEGMASGVRDAWNLCWKLDAVLRGELPESLLDSYQAERQPHVRKVTRAAVNIGRLITERNRLVTTVRDPLMRAAMRVPGLGAFIRSASWFPRSRYPVGFFVRSRSVLRTLGAGRGRTVGGWQVPQPWVLHPVGMRMRMDDALPQGWVVLRTTSTGRDRGAEAWRLADVPVIDVRPPGSKTGSGAIVDTDGSLLAWLAKGRADVVVLRPDGFVYTSAGARGRLAEPPFGAGAHAGAAKAVSARAVA